jgi:hypothetical protein
MIWHYRHHNPNHVREGLGVFPFPWFSKWNWSLHLFLGRPMFLRPFDIYIDIYIYIYIYIYTHIYICIYMIWHYRHNHHHHHHHVHEGLGVFPFPWFSKRNWSFHLFLGHPMFLRPIDIYIYIYMIWHYTNSVSFKVSELSTKLCVWYTKNTCVCYTKHTCVFTPYGYELLCLS